tara:strand:+ start:164 stop:778 length:615 start_codon:yes stop_codon:yes gene_type:complete
MATLTIGGKTVFTQTGTDEPLLKNTVQVESGITLPNSTITNPTFSNPAFKTGTFTPEFQKRGENLALYTYTGAPTVIGKYIKIGPLVFFSILIAHDGANPNYNTGVYNTDGTAIGGFPYLPDSFDSITPNTWWTPAGTSAMGGVTGGWSGYSAIGYMMTKPDPMTQMALYYQAGSTINQVNASVYGGSTAVFRFNGQYFTDQND